MKSRIFGVFLFSIFASDLHAEESVAELRQQLTEVLRYVKTLEKKIDQVEAHQRRIDETSFPRNGNNRGNANLATVANAKTGDNSQSHNQQEKLETDSASLVDLNPQEHASIAAVEEKHVLSNPWWENIEIHGFGAAGYYDTGSAGTRDFGGFEIKESTLWVNADIWEDISLFWELQANRLGKDDSLLVRTGEVHIKIDDIQLGDFMSFGTKIGRFDIPFGEEYLWQDAIDNPLITNSAAYPYGWDEGVLVFGDYNGLNWILAVSDGTDARSIEENSDKAINVKLFGKPTDSLYLSASFRHNGDASKSAVEFGGSHFQPVGASHISSAGVSFSDQVDGDLFELDAKYSFQFDSFDAYLALSAGAATQNDDDSTFDRDFFWFSIEPYLSYKNTWYAVLRYSEIGTYDDQQGYHFDGKIFAGGNGSFGYDTMRFRRLGFGLGWQPNPRVRAKLEIGQDWFELIDGSPLSAKNDSRNFIGAELAVGF